ncbi:MAG TPA: STAS domain-containing protein [Gaiellales bacterium]|jgi:anti-anti-sigma factor|nr:STAS domain-containing protein [Gaiellales bacterium]
MTAQVSIEVEVLSDHAAIVTLRGEHDLHSRPEVAEALAGISACGNVVVDLSACSFLDSAIISALLQTATRLHERGGLLRIVMTGDSHAGVRRLFELMSLERIMPIHSSRAVAVAGLATRPQEPPATARRVRALGEIIDQSNPLDDSRAA